MKQNEIIARRLMKVINVYMGILGNTLPCADEHFSCVINEIPKPATSPISKVENKINEISFNNAFSIFIFSPFSFHFTL